MEEWHLLIEKKIVELFKKMDALDYIEKGHEIFSSVKLMRLSLMTYNIRLNKRVMGDYI